MRRESKASDCRFEISSIAYDLETCICAPAFQFGWTVLEGQVHFISQGHPWDMPAKSQRGLYVLLHEKSTALFPQIARCSSRGSNCDWLTDRFHFSISELLAEAPLGDYIMKCLHPPSGDEIVQIKQKF